MHKPSWFKSDRIMVCTAPTCGLTKGGRLLPLVDPKTGARRKVKDPDTGEFVDAVNDVLLEDMLRLRAGKTSKTLKFLPKETVSMRASVPVYYDRRYDEAFDRVLKEDSRFKKFKAMTLGELESSSMIQILSGHGSPSADQRVGDVPYIKVSDLRAGLVNINPTNRVPLQVAQSFWGGTQSGLRKFDVLSPERTSKNIGDFCVLMPGQEQVLLTKEIIVLRPAEKAVFDSFYLIWALTLKIVRDQWRRIIFMQTNREDVGSRYLEIKVPVPSSRAVADQVSEPMRKYYLRLAEARTEISKYLADSGAHHFFVSGAEQPDQGEPPSEDSGGIAPSESE